MNPTPAQPDPNEELARLLPGPVERDLPSGRHQRLQEFVMTQIDQDLRPAERSPRRSPRRRTVLLASALTAVAAVTAAAVVIGTGDSPRPPSVAPTVASLSGKQVLLAAASTAERTPPASGTYWYIRTADRSAATGKPDVFETWTRRDGRTWFRGDKTGGKVVADDHPTPFRLGGPEVSFARLQKLPTDPDALREWITNSVAHGDVRTSAGKLDARMRKLSVFDGLVALVSQLPAPPKVRAAAFRAIASYANVHSLGAVKGGRGLRFSLPVAFPTASAPSPDAKDQSAKDHALKAKARGGTQDDQVRMVVDPATSQVRETNYFVTTDGAEVTSPSGMEILAEWTSRLPR